MEYDLFFFCDLSYFLNGLDRSNFIICMHYRDQNWLWSNCFFNIIRIHDTVLAYRKICNFETVFFEIFTGVKDGMMFYRACYDMVAFCPVLKSVSFYRKVIGFCSTACEYDLLFFSANKVGDKLSCFLDSSSCLSTYRVEA